MAMEMPSGHSASWQSGYSSGWDHANLVTAYGGNTDLSEKEIENHMSGGAVVWNDYLDGFREGVNAYTEQEYLSETDESEDPWPYAEDPRER